MNPSKEEIKLLRELAKRYAEVASSDAMRSVRQRMTENNDLISGRPPVLINEVPWHEMDVGGKLQNLCIDSFSANMETFFRRSLFQWEYFPADMYLEPVFAIPKSFSSSGNGLDIKENQLAADDKNNIVSHEYIDQLEKEEDVDKFHFPVLTLHPEMDEANVSMAREILGDVLPVELRGRELYLSPWDDISMYRGITPILYDLADRPEHLHRIMSRYMACAAKKLEQMEAMGLLENRNPYLHCTPQFSEDLPQKDNESPMFKDVWLRTMAQMFGTVSVDMHEEFDCLYTKPLADRCALVYYGCCEPLDTKIPMLKRTYKNLRKIGVSPWANEEVCGEQIGKDFVYARKPNPSMVSMMTDPNAIREETRKTVEVCMKNGCAYEFVLKDISTVSYKPQNLFIWEKTVRETLDEYYK